jgi:O-antigen/teichoic acid export membrane protein/putative flippase GtrA
MKFLHAAASLLFHNKTPRQTVAKNTLWLLIGQVTSRAFSYALGIATFITVLSDIGINALITKETTRNPAMKDRYLGTAFLIKICLAGAFALTVFMLSPYLSKIAEARSLLPILIFVFIFDTLRDLGSALARALEKMEIEAGVHIFTNASIVTLGFILLTINRSSASLALAYAIGSGLGLITIIYTLRAHFKNLLYNIDFSLIGKILKTAWPFGLLGLMGIVMLETDIIMLGWLRSAEEVGYYSAAQKIVQLLYIFPTFLAVSVFPAMARSVATDPGFIKRTLERLVSLVLIAAIPIAAIGIVLAPFLFPLLFGNAYIPAILAFQLLIATVVVVFPSSLIGNAIFAYDAQKNFVRFSLIAIFGNVAFNLLLIPSLGIEGAALSTILTQVIVNTLMWKKMRELSGFSVLNAFQGLYGQAVALLNKITTRTLTRQMLKFGIVGTFNAFVDIGILNLLSAATGTYSGKYIILFNLTSFGVAVTLSYIFNKRWTFRHHGRAHTKEIVQYFGIYTIGAGINTGIVFFITTFLSPLWGLSPHTWLNIAKLVAIPLASLWNFSAIRILFLKRKNSAAL